MDQAQALGVVMPVGLAIDPSAVAVVEARITAIPAPTLRISSSVSGGTAMAAAAIVRIVAAAAAAQVVATWLLCFSVGGGWSC